MRYETLPDFAKGIPKNHVTDSNKMKLPKLVGQKNCGYSGIFMFLNIF